MNVLETTWPGREVGYGVTRNVGRVVVGTVTEREADLKAGKVEVHAPEFALMRYLQSRTDDARDTAKLHTRKELTDKIKAIAPEVHPASARTAIERATESGQLHVTEFNKWGIRMSAAIAVGLG